MDRVLRIPLGAAALLALAGCTIQVNGSGISALSSIQGSGVRKTEARSVVEFHKIVIEGAADLTVTAGREKSVVVEIDDNLLKLITTNVSDGTLTIGSKGSFNTNSGRLKVTITAPSVDGLNIDGSADATLTGIHASHLDVEVGGSGKVTATGVADNLKFTVNGSGTGRFLDLHAKEASVDVNGSGRADVNATSKLNVQISGSGTVRYTGDPKVTKDISGSGSVDPI